MAEGQGGIANCRGRDVSMRESRSAIRTLCRGKSTMEYAVLVAIVAAALVAMHTYVRRAMQANLKNLELELNAAR